MFKKKPQQICHESFCEEPARYIKQGVALCPDHYRAKFGSKAETGAPETRAS